MRFADVAAVAVYPVPDPRTGDEVMAALELLPGRQFDPDAFGAFLVAQRDLGTKWVPAFLRVTDSLPHDGERQGDQGVRSAVTVGGGPRTPSTGAGPARPGTPRATSVMAPATWPPACAELDAHGRSGSGGRLSPSRRPGRRSDRGRLDRLDAFLQRHRATALASATYAKWNDDSAGRLANLVAYSAFLAVFPLLLVLLTLAEVLLVGHKAVQQEVIDAALRQFPEIGTELAAHVNGLTGKNTVFLAVVLVWLVYGCLRLSRNAQTMMATVWAGPPG